MPTSNQNNQNRSQSPDPADDGLPANTEAERFVLGSVLLDAERHLAAVRSALRPYDFVLKNHQTIFRRILDLDDRGEKIDHVIVANELDSHKELATCDGLGYLVSLDEGMPRLPNIDGYITILKEKSRRRRAVRWAGGLVKRGMETDEPTESLVTSGAEFFQRLQSEEPRGKAKPIIYTYADVPLIWEYESMVSYLVSDFLPEGAITLLTGDSGHGKTLFATALAGAIVTGGEFLGRQATRRRVLYLDRENPLALVKQHLFDLHIERTPDLIYWGGWCEHPADGPAAASLHDFARAEQPVLIFDSLIAFHPGDEQDASETRRYFQYFRNLTAAGATIILLHHTGKSENAKQYRGSTDIKASVDMAWLIEKLGDSAGLLSELRIVPFKNRIGAGKTIPVSFRDGQFVTEKRAESNLEIFERVLGLHPNSKQNEIVKLGMAAGLPKHRIEELLVQGVQQGRLQLKVGKQGSKQYSLAEPTLGEI
jgi:KaiC/GvpD/RAD55 family RecA-like ATPase